MKGLFVTGTDTGVGKTVVTAELARILRKKGIRLGVCKPVATGAELRNGSLLSEDTMMLARAAGLEGQTDRITPKIFREPAAPPVAAAAEGKTLSLDDLVQAVQWWEAHCDFVLVEGVGGLLCPLTEKETVADLAHYVGLPLIVVSRTTLGTLNHTLLTLEVAEKRDLAIRGVVLNQVHPPSGSLAEKTTIQQLQQRLAVPVLAVVGHHENANSSVACPELESIVSAFCAPSAVRQ